MSRFLNALNSGRVLLMDGAMGTELQRAGLKEGECGEIWNLTHPDQVRAIHAAYVRAGAESLSTNTFLSHRAALTYYRRNYHLKKINRAAFALAQSVCEPSHFILADLGPIVMDRPVTLHNREEVKRMIRALPRADAILLETWSDPSALWLAQYARIALAETCRVPVLLSLTFRHERSHEEHRDELVTSLNLGGKEAWRKLPEWYARKAHHYGIAALGVNCGRDIGMDEVIEIIRRYRQVTDLPLFARPNAGTPTRVGDGWVYPHSPQAMAARLPELLEAGVCMVGGCCGTTPAHIAAFRAVIDEWNARSPMPRLKG